jgi:hypothetical protein
MREKDLATGRQNHRALQMRIIIIYNAYDSMSQKWTRQGLDKLQGNTYMCNKNVQQPVGSNPIKTAEDPVDSDLRRRRLWELAHGCHCPLVGVCLPLAVLRKLVDKAVRGQVIADDYEMHVGVVAQCTSRNRISNVLQRELDRRYAATVRRFSAAKTVEAIAQYWIEAIEKGDLAGAFWAGLTHPCCNAALQDTMCRDIHMIQHQAGAHVRADIGKLAALVEQNAVLKAELEKAQDRSTRALAEKSAEIARLHASLVKTQADVLAKDTVIASLKTDLAEFQSLAPDLEHRIRLKEKNTQLANRLHAMKGEIEELRQQLSTALEHLDNANNAAQPAALIENMPTQQELPSIADTVCLNEKTVLCVGGRTGSIAIYRTLIERVGGRFAHHDGGLKDNPNLLDASLAAADLVICQAGCISHNAYWRVKEVCKRTGKRCIFVDNPSASGLARGLERISQINAEPRDEDTARLEPQR